LFGSAEHFQYLTSRIYEAYESGVSPYGTGILLTNHTQMILIKHGPEAEQKIR